MHILDLHTKSVHENAHFGSACENMEFHVQNEILNFGSKCEIPELHSACMQNNRETLNTLRERF
jgi:hypothetical protein